MNRSPGPTPCSAFTTNRQPSASCELALDPPLHPLGERVARALHARKVDQHELPVRRRSRSPRIARRVVCGLSETIATLAPTIALASVDLPTFGRPASATKPERVSH